MAKKTQAAPAAKKTTTKAAPAAAKKTAPAAKPAAAAVSLRGGIAATKVSLTSKPYRVGAPHNVAWWNSTVSLINKGKGTANVADMLLTESNPQGVPGHFLGYVIRRGYLQAA